MQILELAVSVNNLHTQTQMHHTSKEAALARAIFKMVQIEIYIHFPANDHNSAATLNIVLV